jgi:hypothetical protein
LRLLLDLHVSGRAVGGPLRADGHDVVAGDEVPRYRGMPDADLLVAATAEGRVVVTFDVDYDEVVQDCVDEGIDHAGVILILGLGTNEFGAMLRAIRAVLAQLPEQESWRNLLMRVGRSPA